MKLWFYWQFKQLLTERKWLCDVTWLKVLKFCVKIFLFNVFEANIADPGSSTSTIYTFFVTVCCCLYNWYSWYISRVFHYRIRKQKSFCNTSVFINFFQNNFHCSTFLQPPKPLLWLYLSHFVKYYITLIVPSSRKVLIIFIFTRENNAKSQEAKSGI